MRARCSAALISLLLFAVEAFKRTVLDAKSIAYLRIGSGLYLHDLFERMGIASTSSARCRRRSSTTSFSSAIGAKSQAPDAARELMHFLASPRSLAVIKAQGMEPGT